MIRARHQGAWSFRMLTLAVGLAFLLTIGGLGYAGEAAKTSAEATGTAAPPVEKPAPAPVDPQPTAPAADPAPAAPAPDAAAPAPDTAAPAVDPAPVTDPALAAAKSAAGAASLAPAVITPACNGYIEGWKYNDSVTGHPGIGGFVFKLKKQNSSGGWDLVGTQTSDSSGYFKFSTVFAGTYKVFEDAKTYWTPVGSAESQVITFTNDDSNAKVYFHNKEQAHKKFELTLTNAPTGYTYRVEYTVNSGSVKSLALSLSGGVYTGQDDSLMYGDTIDYVNWIGTKGGVDKLLQHNGSETLTGAHLPSVYCNTASYSFKGSIEGFKYNAVSGKPGLDGFSFQLQKKSGSSWSDVGSPVTSSGGGHFSFANLDAGTYRVQEQLTSSQNSKGWTCTTGATSGELTVESGAASVEFGNREAAHKVFTLTAPNPGSGNSYQVSYKVNGGAAQVHTLSLSGGKYVYEDTSLWQGDVLSDIQWILLKGSTAIVLHTDGSETLTGTELPGSYQNSWSYTPKFKIEGTKLIAGAGSADGFQFQLQKQSGSSWSDVGSPVTSSGGGHFEFTDLEAGTYRVRELDRDYWECTTANPSSGVTFSSGDNSETPGRVSFTNVEKAHKVFVLTMSHPWTDLLIPWVSYKVNGQDRTGILTSAGGGQYKFEDTDLHQGDVISDVTWKATKLLDTWTMGSTSGETLTGTHLPSDYTNPFTWDSKVSGHKIVLPSWSGLTVSTVNAVQGWEIHLGSKVTYTDSTGYYEFTGIAPGTFPLTEVLKAGWFQVSAPASPVTIVSDTNLTNQDFTNVAVQADVSITKDGPVLAHVGQTITYVITVKNTGNTPIHDVKVSDATIGFTGTVPGTMAPNDTYTFNPTYTIKSTDPDPLVNTATVTAKDVAGGPVGPKTAVHTVDIIHPAISLTKTPSVPEVLIGGTVTYTLVVTNTGDTPLHDGVVNDTTFGKTFNVVGDLAASGGQATFTFDEVLSVSGNQRNDATTSGKDMLVDVPGEAVRGTVTADAHADVTVQTFLGFHAPILYITKSANHSTVAIGDVVTYTLTVKNAGDLAATNYTVTDTFDTGAMTVSDAGGGTVGGSQIVWHFAGPLDVGATQTITYKLRVKDELPAGQTTIKNHVHLDNPNDGDLTHGKDGYWTLNTGGLPFLPFTGADLTLYLILAGTALVLAIAFRGLAKVRAH
jgi:uncharacterized repeat protein (TIGR01451 family)